MADTHNQRDSESAPPPDSNEPDLSPAELRRFAQEISALYPPPRLGTELVLLEVNPHRAHAYWNIDVDVYQAAVARSGDDASVMLLRVHDVTGVSFDGANSHSYFDIQVQGLQGHWYIDLWTDGRTYLAELGLRPGVGAFLPIARSNSVSTPRASESNEYHTQAVDTAQRDVRILDLRSAEPDTESGAAPIAAEPGLPVELNPPPVRPVLPVPEEAFHPAGKPAEPAFAPAAFVPEAEPREFPVAPFNGVGVDEPAAEVDAIFDRADRARVMPAPVPEPAPAPISPSPPTAAARREEAYAHWPTADELSRRVPDTSGSAPREEPAAEHAPASTGSVPVAPPAPAPQTGPAPTPATPAAAEPEHVPLENYVKLTSYAEQRPQVALEVNVELHIYGRAKPGTQLSLYGIPVTLQPDGSFSIRKPLPHGAVVLPLLAVDPPPQA